ncbi:MAG: adenosylcobalamin-dependent ribonucleoside-diphosphate reductase [Cyclobacteriaceae bacterium]
MLKTHPKKNKDLSLPIEFPGEIEKQIVSTKPKTFSSEEVIRKTAEYFDGDSLAANVWLNKYALKDSEGNIYEDSPEAMHRRMAKEIFRIEQKYENPLSEKEIFDCLDRFKYIIPQGGSMSGIGNNYQIASLSNCFVIGNKGESDSYGGVMKIDEEQVQLMKRRGGVGHDLSHIRPKGSPVKNSALTSTGIVPFMERYSNTTREVAQDGRRGALMLSISVKHPDIQEFVDAKLDGTKVTGANVSVKIDEDFMTAVENNTNYCLAYPINSPAPKVKVDINARKLWEKIVHNAWKSAEPGILFWDNIIKESIPDCYDDFGFKTVSTNPCGEIPLCPYDSCRLIAINLFGFVDDPFTPQAKFNFLKFKKHVGLAQRIMDDIIDLELEKIDKVIAKIDADPELMEVKRTELNLWKKIKGKCIEGRRAGLGITAEGDMLAALGLRYGTDEAEQHSVEVHKTLALEAYRSSVQLARERGCFPIFDVKREIDNPFIKRIKDADNGLYEEMMKHGRRNIALLTIAPTGTTSLMSQTTSGIEPAFKISYKRRRKVNPTDKNARVDFVDEMGDKWEEHHVLHHHFASWLKANDYDPKAVSKSNDKEIEQLIKTSPYFRATAEDIDWTAKVKMQGAIQKWVDHSISVTVNVPSETSKDTIGDIYMQAWRNGCKGVTVYREGSRSGVLVSEKEKEEKVTDFLETKAPKRPKILQARVIRFKNNHENWIAVVGMYNDRPYEIFTGKEEHSFSILANVNEGWVIKNKSENGKNRYDFQYKDIDGYRVTIEGLSRTFNQEYWNYAKLISGILRHGMPIKFIVSLVDNLHLDNASLNTWKNGVIRTLKKFIPDGTKPSDTKCGACGDESLVYEEGCLTCKSCGHTKCG